MQVIHMIDPTKDSYEKPEPRKSWTSGQNREVSKYTVTSMVGS